MIPDTEGRYLAWTLERGVGDTGPNELATFMATFQLAQVRDAAGNWTDLPQEPVQTISSYFYLEKKDGDPNEFAINKLREAYGWDGQDPFWLQDAELPDDHLVQLTLAYENDQQGRPRMRVQFIDAADATGFGVKRTEDDAAKQALRNKMVPKLGAVAGGATPAKTPPGGRPTPPATGKKGAPRRRSAPAEKPWTEERAWGHLVQLATTAGKDKQAEQEAIWFEVLGSVGPDADQFTADNWAKIADIIGNRFNDEVPF